MVYFLGIPPDQQSLIYADTDLQDHNTLEQYRIPNNGKIQQVLKGRADDRSELPLTELPPSPSPPSPEAIVVVSQSTVACYAMETEPVEPNGNGTEPQEEVEETQEEVEETQEEQENNEENEETEETINDEEQEEPMAKRQCVE